MKQKPKKHFPFGHGPVGPPASCQSQWSASQFAPSAQTCCRPVVLRPNEKQKHRFAKKPFYIPRLNGTGESFFCFCFCDDVSPFRVMVLAGGYDGSLLTGGSIHQQHRRHRECLHRHKRVLYGFCSKKNLRLFVFAPKKQ